MIFHNYLKACDLIGRDGFSYDAHNLFMAALISMFQLPPLKFHSSFFKIKCHKTYCCFSKRLIALCNFFAYVKENVLCVYKVMKSEIHCWSLLSFPLFIRFQAKLLMMATSLTESILFHLKCKCMLIKNPQNKKRNNITKGKLK